MRADVLAWSVPILFAAFSLCFLLLSRLHRSLLWWSAAFLVAGVGFAVTVVPTAPGSIFKPAAEDTLFLIALAIANAAFAVRAGRRPRWRMPAAIVGLGSAGAAGGIVVLEGAILYEVLAVQTACAALMLLSAYEMRSDTVALRPLLVGLCVTVAVSLGFQNLLLLSAPPEGTNVSNWRDSTWGFVFQLNGAVTGLLVATSVILATTFDIISRLREESTEDALTGALNRRGLERRIEALRKTLGPDARLALILSDLDHFKSINDRFGHEAGDAVLCGYAALCSEVVGAGGHVARIGGEEFAILLVGPGEDAATELAETIRLSARRVRWPERLGGVFVTASFGVVTIAEQETLFDAIDRADTLLYRAKSDGRDKVVVDAAGAPSSWLGQPAARASAALAR